MGFEVLLAIFSVFVGGLITHLYYRKSSNEPPEWPKELLAKLAPEASAKLASGQLPSFLSAMIYSIGIRLKYERAFAAAAARKEGRRVNPDGTPYPGGFVFRTADDARRFLAEKGLTGTHMVMGVNADWDRDAEAELNRPYRRLIADADLVKLD
jgi:hypothetical protein